MNNSASSKLREILQTKQGKTYTVALVTFGTIFFLFFFAIRPAWLSITNKVEENAAKQKYIDDATAKLSTMRNLDSLYLQKYTAITLLNNYFLTSKLEDSFNAKNLMPLILKRNLILESYRIQSPRTLEDQSIILDSVNVAQIEISFNVYGELSDLESFLEDLETLPKIINVKSVSYSSVSTGDIFTKPWQMTIRADMYLWDIDNLRALYGNG